MSSDKSTARNGVKSIHSIKCVIVDDNHSESEGWPYVNHNHHFQHSEQKDIEDTTEASRTDHELGREDTQETVDLTPLTTSPTQLAASPNDTLSSILSPCDSLYGIAATSPIITGSKDPQPFATPSDYFKFTAVQQPTDSNDSNESKRGINEIVTESTPFDHFDAVRCQSSLSPSPPIIPKATVESLCSILCTLYKLHIYSQPI